MTPARSGLILFVVSLLVGYLTAPTPTDMIDTSVGPQDESSATARNAPVRGGLSSPAGSSDVDTLELPPPPPPSAIGWIRGTVVDTWQEPLPGVRVVAAPAITEDRAIDDAERKKQWAEDYVRLEHCTAETTTRDDGSFELTGLCSTTYRLVIEHPGYERYAPLTSYAPGSHVRVTISVITEKLTIDLRGANDERLGPEARLDARSVDPLEWRLASVTSPTWSGHPVELAIPPGGLHVSAQCVGFSTEERVVSPAQFSPGDTLVMNLVPTPSILVNVTMPEESERIVTGCCIMPFEPGRSLAAEQLSWAGRWGSYGGDGYLFPDLRPGRYQIGVSVSAHPHIRRMVAFTSGGLESPHGSPLAVTTEVEVSEGLCEAHVDVPPLRAGPASFRLAVRGLKNELLDQVSLRVVHDGTGTRRQGSFEMDRSQGGSYLVNLLDETSQRIFLGDTPGTLTLHCRAQGLEGERDAELLPGQPEVEVSFATGEKVRIRVRHGPHPGLPGELRFSFTNSQRQAFHYGPCRFEGDTTEIGPLPPGDYRLDVAMRSITLSVSDVVINEGTSNPVDVEIPELHDVSVHVSPRDFGFLAVVSSGGKIRAHVDDGLNHLLLPAGVYQVTDHRSSSFATFSVPAEKEVFIEKSQ